MSKKSVTKMAFGIVFLCFLLSTFMSLWSLHLMVVENLKALSKSLAAQIYDVINMELSEPTIVARTMAQDRFLVSILEAEEETGDKETSALMADYLTGLKEGLGYEAAFVISEKSKQYYSHSGMTKTIDPLSNPHDVWYPLFVEQNLPYDLDVDRDEMNSDDFTVFVNARVESQDGKLLGVCGIGENMNQTQQLFLDLEKEYGVKINLIDKTGLIQVDTNENQIENAYLKGLSLTQTDYGYQRKDWDGFVITKFIDRLGWYLVIQSNENQHMYSILQLLLLNIVAYLLVTAIISHAIRILIARTEALAHVSFRDNMTSLFNRRAFEEDKERLSKNDLDNQLVCLTADLNGLKTTNDTLGHEAGDELIQAGAQVLLHCLGSYGHVYRIGGDEFAAVLTLSEEELLSALQKLKDECASWKGEKAKELSISVGYALRKEFPSENLSELMRIADEEMYKAKEAHYKAKGIERRK
ncbi:MAG: GGDEF domain-containing protein, partial [Blautia sp.]|nr:GGDEF domain-containing protein [Blautia sp.]